MKGVRFFLLATVVLATASATGQNQSADSPSRNANWDQSAIQVQTAYRAYREKQDATLAELETQMKQSVLAPYPRYWRIQLEMDKGAVVDRPAVAAAVSDFLSSHPNSMLANRLLGDWLKHHGRGEDWATVRRYFSQVVDPDVELTCYGWRAMMADGSVAFSDDAQALWQRSLRTPAACQPVFNNLVEKQAILPLFTIERIYLLWRLKFDSSAKALAERLPSDSGFSSGGYERAMKTPAATAYNDGETKTTRLFALLRLSRSDPAQAVSAWKTINGNALYTVPEQALFWNLIGFEGANRLMSEAADWFSNAPVTNDYWPKINTLAAWKARAGIRASRWSLIFQATSQMNPSMAALPDWIFWRAKALSMMGRTAEANSLWSSIANQPVYYGVLAAEQLGQPVVLPPSSRATELDRQMVWAMEPMQRAMLLFDAGLRTEALREWFWATRGMNDRQLLATAEIALQRGLVDRAISAADRTEMAHNYEYRYPTPHRAVIRRNAITANLEETWVFGLIRQESRFVVDAKSSAGASGLMQLMPATARWTAKRIGMTDFSPSRVNDIDTNVRLGTAYLDYVLDRFDRQLPLGFAGYNAGPGRPGQWRAAVALDGPAYIETIPFDETRDYVKKVLANVYFYDKVLGKASTPLTTMSSTIAPR